MNATLKNKAAQAESWPRKVTFGRVSVTVYKRETPSGNDGFQVVNYSGEKRRLDSYATEADAMEAAHKLARQLSQRDVLGASMTKEQSIEYASAIQTLQPLGIALTPAISTLAEAVKLVGDLSGVIAAARFFKTRKKTLTAKPVSDVVVELIKVKESRKASARYLKDLHHRLNKFEVKFQVNIGNIETASIQEWLDGLKLSSQSYMNFRRVVSLLFEFAVARKYASENPVDGVETIKIRNANVEIYTPTEMQKLLTASSPDFLPCLTMLLT